MAEQVEITNVGNNGVASEVTLKLLLNAMDKLAKNAGIDANTVKERIKQYKEEGGAIDHVIHSMEDQKKAIEENTEAVENSTSWFRKSGSMLLNSAQIFAGALAGSARGITLELFESETSLRGFANELPFVGHRLGSLAGYLDTTMESFRSLSSVGASFNNSLTDLRVTAAESHMALSDYTEMVRRNSERLSGFGGTVTNGAMQTRKLFKELGNTQQQLMNMGLSVSDINEGLIFYQYLNRAGSRVQSQSTKDQAQAAAEYIKNMNTLAKLTGKDAKTMQESIAAQQSDVAMQMKLSKMSTEERAKFQQQMTTALSVGGEVAVQRFKEIFLGLPPMTEETRIYAATIRNAEAELQGMVRSISDASVSAEQLSANGIDQMGDLMVAYAKDANSLGDLLTMASAGAEGPMKTMFDIFKQNNVDMAKYFDKNGVLNEKQLRADFEAAKIEADKQEKVTNAMAGFEKSINDIKSSIVSQLVESGVFEAAGTAIEAFGKFMSAVFTPERLSTIGDGFKYLANMFTNLASSFSGMSLDDIVINTLSALVIGIKDLFLKGIAEAPWTTAIVAGITLAFAAVKSKNLINALTGGAAPTAGAGPGNLARNAGVGAGAGLRGLGRGLGQGLGAIITGIGNALALLGPKSPLILAGAAAVGGSITLIGAGIAGATWIIGASLPKFAEGIKAFEDIDGENLKQVGIGLGLFSVGLLAFGAGAVVGAVGNIVGNILDGLNSMVGGNSILDNLEEFASYNIDANRVENNAKAVIAFSLAMTAAGAGRVASSFGSLVSTIFDGLTLAFRGDPLPYANIIKFSKQNFDYDKINANAKAIRAFADALQDFPEINRERVGGLFGAIGDIFSGEIIMPWDRVKEFGNVDINVDRVSANATAISAFASAFENFPTIDGERVGGLFGAIGDIFSGVANMPWDQVVKFGNVDINVDRVTANATAIRAFADAFQNFSEINGERVGGLFGAIGDIFSGVVNMPWDQVVKFGNVDIKVDKVAANATAIRAFADAFQNFPTIDGERVGGLFGAIGYIFSGAINMPWDQVKEFGNAEINITGLAKNAVAIKLFADAFQNFPEINGERVGGLFGAIGLIFSGVVNMPWDRVNDFGNAEINSAGVATNAVAIKLFADAFRDFPELNGERVGGLFGAIGYIFSGAINMPWDRVNDFGNTEINSAGVIANATAIRTFSDAFQNFPELNGERVGGVFGAIASIFSGSITMPWDRVNEFGNAKISGTGVATNAVAMKSFATAFQNFPEINGERVGGFFSWIVDQFAGQTKMPWDTVIEFGNLDIDGSRVKKNAEALTDFANGIRSLDGTNFETTLTIGNETIQNLTKFSNIGSDMATTVEQLRILSTLTGIAEPVRIFNDTLDVDAVSSYADAITDLKDALEELNSELGRSNDTLLKDKLSSGELMQSITSTNTANAESIQSLNITLREILGVLSENKDIDSKIERNTRTNGFDISRGKITNI